MPHPEQDPSESFKSTGKVMVFIGWIFALAVLTYGFGNWEEEQVNPNRMPVSSYSENNSIEVKLQRNRFGHYVASGKINGYPIDFLVDTGATDVALPMELANKIGLTKGPSQRAFTANGTAEVFSTMLDTISLGEINLQNIDASIAPGMNGNKVLLGMAFLRHVDFSQQEDILTLTQYTYSADNP